MHDLSWFEERKGKTIKRIAYDTRTDREKISYQPVTDESVDYLFNLQSKNIRFEENNPKTHRDFIDPFTNDAPIVRIHKSGMDDACFSCEG